MSTHNVCFSWKYKKNIYLDNLLIWSSDTSPLFFLFFFFFALHRPCSLNETLLIVGDNPEIKQSPGIAVCQS